MCQGSQTFFGLHSTWFPTRDQCRSMFGKQLTGNKLISMWPSHSHTFWYALLYSFFPFVSIYWGLMSSLNPPWWILGERWMEGEEQSHETLAAAKRGGHGVFPFCHLEWEQFSDTKPVCSDKIDPEELELSFSHLAYLQKKKHELKTRKVNCLRPLKLSVLMAASKLWLWSTSGRPHSRWHKVSAPSFQ